MRLNAAFLLAPIAFAAVLGGEGRAENAPVIANPARFSLAETRSGGECATVDLLDDGCAPTECPTERLFEPLDVALPEQRRVDPPGRRRSAAVSYQVSDSLSAGLSYRHSLLFGIGEGQALRSAPFNDFATDRERDILNLQLSWRLRWASFLDLGYRFDSPRAAPGAVNGLSLNRFWPEEGHRTHSLMLGVRREWGGN